MSSIGTPKNVAPPPQGQSDIDPQDQNVPTSDGTTYLSGVEEPKTPEELEALGQVPGKQSGVTKPEANNKFSPDALITGQPPPLPADRAPVTAETQVLFESLNDEINTALAAGGHKPINGKTVGSGPVLSELATITDADMETPEGQQRVQQLVGEGVRAAALDIGNMSNSGMMAAFMILQVKNEASGKEITATLQDLTADARKTSLDVQISQNRAAQQKVEEARKKQKLMKILGPLIEAIMAIAFVLGTIFTGGSATVLMVTAAAAVIGFVVGGAVGGAKKGNGFDIGSAFSGLAIGGSVGAMMSKLIVKLISTLLLRVGAEVIGKQVAAQGAKIAMRNLSNKGSMAVQTTAFGVQAAGTIAQAGLNYDYETTLADAKEHQAKAKMEKAISDMLQNQYEAMSTTLRGMLDTRNAAVNQMLAMLKSQFSAMQKTVSGMSV